MFSSSRRLFFLVLQKGRAPSHAVKRAIKMIRTLLGIDQSRGVELEVLVRKAEETLQGERVKYVGTEEGTGAGNERGVSPQQWLQDN